MEGAPRLTQGAVREIWELPDGPGTIQPVLQVADLRPVTTKNHLGHQSERYRMLLSDGVHSQQPMLATTHNHLVKTGALCLGSVVHLHDITCNTIQTRSETAAPMAKCRTRAGTIGPWMTITQRQTLSSEDIEAIKREGASGNAIVEALIGNSSIFGNKTVFSQDAIEERESSAVDMVARFLMKTVSQVATGNQPVGTVAYIGNIHHLMQCKSAVNTAEDWLNPATVKEVFEARALRMAVNCARTSARRQAKKKVGVAHSFYEFSPDVLEAAVAHVQLIIVAKFIEKMQEDIPGPGVKEKLQKLCSIYAVHLVHKHLAGERATAHFDVDAMNVAWAGSRHAVEVADRIARIIASDPVSTAAHPLSMFLLPVLHGSLALLPLWDYRAGDDELRLRSSDFPAEELSTVMAFLLGGDPGNLPEALSSLYHLNDQADRIAALPVFDEWGLWSSGGLVGRHLGGEASDKTVEDCPANVPPPSQDILMRELEDDAATDVDSAVIPSRPTRTSRGSASAPRAMQSACVPDPQKYEVGSSLAHPAFDGGKHEDDAFVTTPPEAALEAPQEETQRTLVFTKGVLNEAFCSLGKVIVAMVNGEKETKAAPAVCEEAMEGAAAATKRCEEAEARVQALQEEQAKVAE
ncbi:Peroxisomal acyl-coenzyme A oxidase 1 [Hordeum vulgare]|nr:Peroxisomal acyl-coenzyme A oxidase 1 [Hordeum vulgare]